MATELQQLTPTRRHIQETGNFLDMVNTLCLFYLSHFSNIRVFSIAGKAWLGGVLQRHECWGFEHSPVPSHGFIIFFLMVLKFLPGFCTNRDISISQSRYSSTGIPQYIVQIVNTCISSGCPPSNIHLHCGWFASARMVNPTIFKRISYDDCLINGGKPLETSQIISFTYSNSFMYPLSFKSAKFC